MTLNELETLTEDELAICLHVVNVLFPTDVPKMQYTPRQLTWFRHEMLMQKFVDAIPHLLPEGHAPFMSLMHKLGEVEPEEEFKQLLCPPIQTETTGSQPSSTTTSEKSPST